MLAVIQFILEAALTIGLVLMFIFVIWTVIRGIQVQLLELKFRRHLQNKHFEEALEVIEQSLRISPGDAFLYYQRAKVWAEMGDHQAAESDYTLGMRYGHGATAYAGRAAARYALNHYKEALVDANHAIACSRLWWRGYYERGRVYAALGHYAVALDDFNQAFDLNRLPPADLYLARAETAARLGDEEAAHRDRTKAESLQ
jgi:tetratricopeptide (TPR) repeat protein